MRIAVRLSRTGAWLALVAVLVLAFLLALADIVHADEQVGPAEGDDTLRLVQVLNVVVGTVLPILVGLVTRVTTRESVKAWLLAGLTVAGAFITTYVNDPSAFDFFQAVLTAIVSFMTSVAFYYGLWKPTGVAARAQAVGSGRAA